MAGRVEKPILAYVATTFDDPTLKRDADWALLGFPMHGRTTIRTMFRTRN